MFSLKISCAFFLSLGSQNFTSWLTYCVTMLDKCLKHILSDFFHFYLERFKCIAPFKFHDFLFNFCSQFTLSIQTLLPSEIPQLISKLCEVLPFCPQQHSILCLSTYVYVIIYLFCNIWFFKISSTILNVKNVSIMAYYFIT